MDTAMVITNKTKTNQSADLSCGARLMPVRSMSRCFGLLLLATCSSLAVAQVAQPSRPNNSFSDDGVPASNVLAPGDQINVNVFSTPELSGPLRVDQNGGISLPVGGRLQVSGLTPLETATAIENRLRTGQILLDPHVIVVVTQFATQGVTILGEVKSPGIYPVRGSSSLYDALSLAGGPTATEGGEITISRREDPEHPIVVLVDSPNYSAAQRSTSIVPGDTVLVSKAASIFVVGDVKSPGQYPMPYGRQLSILNILALTQGLNPTAASKRAAIVRATRNGGAETIPLDLEKIMKNEAPNIVLEASDVLVVPRSGLKSFEQFALPALTNAAVSAGVSSAVLR